MSSRSESSAAQVGALSDIAFSAGVRRHPRFVGLRHRPQHWGAAVSESAAYPWRNVPAKPLTQTSAGICGMARLLRRPILPEVRHATEGTHMKIDVDVYDRGEDSAPGAIFLESDCGNVLLHVRTNVADEPVTAVLTRFDIGVLVGALTWIEEGVDAPV